MHAQRVTEVRALHGDGVVEVLCVFAVDGEDRLAAQVKALCVFFVADGLVADALGFIEHFLRENMRNAVLLYNGIGADTRAAAAENLLHAGICPVTAVILLQRCHDLVAVFRAV